MLRCPRYSPGRVPCRVTTMQPKPRGPVDILDRPNDLAINLANKVARKLHDLAFRASAGLGTPISVDAWNCQYASGHWDYLANISELGRYAVVASYVGRLRPRGTILDVGCGAGLLRSRFDAVEFETYTGIDISREAVRQATEKGFARTRFVVGDFNETIPDTRFGVVIFNDSIGYSHDPAETFQKYWNFLARMGSWLSRCMMSVSARRSCGATLRRIARPSTRRGSQTRSVKLGT